MGQKNSYVTPIPEDYYALTIIDGNIIWLAQFEEKVILDTLEIIKKTWIYGIKWHHKKNHYNSSTKRNHLYNTIICLNEKPFDFDLNHSDILPTICSDKMFHELYSYFYKNNYKLITNGRFIRSIEATSYLFHYEKDLFQSGNTHELSERFSTINLEGINKLVIVNLKGELIRNILSLLKSKYKVKNWQVFDLASNRQISSDTTGSISEVQCDSPRTITIEFQDYIWDSFKTNTEVSPQILLDVFRLMKESNYHIRDSLIYRGNISTIILERKISVIKNIVNYIGISLVHQNKLRIYNCSDELSQCLEKIITRHIYGEVRRNQIKTIEGIVFHEIEYSDNAWCISEWDKENMMSVRFGFSKIFLILKYFGIELRVNINAYISQYDKGILIFEQIDTFDQLNKLTNYSYIRNPEIEERKNARLGNSICITPYDVDKISCIGMTPAQQQHLVNSLKTAALNVKLLKEDREKLNKRFRVNQESSMLPCGLGIIQDSVGPTEMYKLQAGENDCLFISTGKDLVPNYLDVFLFHEPWLGTLDWLNPFRKCSKKKFSFKVYQNKQCPLGLVCWLYDKIKKENFQNVIDNVSRPDPFGEEDVKESEIIENQQEYYRVETVETNLFTVLDLCSNTHLTSPSFIYSVNYKFK